MNQPLGKPARSLVVVVPWKVITNQVAAPERRRVADVALIIDTFNVRTMIKQKLWKDT